MKKESDMTKAIRRLRITGLKISFDRIFKRANGIFLANI